MPRTRTTTAARPPDDYLKCAFTAQGQANELLLPRLLSEQVGLAIAKN